jgi:fumarylpyruvate hydrolase
MTDVIPRPPSPVLPIVDSPPGSSFPVRRIYCVGQNYAAHAIEMGSSGREAPFFFMKPADAILAAQDHGTILSMHYPSLTAQLHYEVELVIAIGHGGRAIAPAQALAHVWGYAVGLDMTRRDLQAQAKERGRPWCVAKGFDESAPISALRPAHACTLGADSAITLQHNGSVRQHSTLGHMIWSVPEIIAQLSLAWTLAPGDLIFTGTPSGVGPVEVGDQLQATITGVGSLAVQIVAPR